MPFVFVLIGVPAWRLINNVFVQQYNEVSTRHFTVVDPQVPIFVWLDGTIIVYYYYHLNYNMYGNTYRKSMDQPGKVANPARSQLNRENEKFPVRVRG